jgi:hypothetical protein
MIAFIDDHREAHGVEPICKVLPIAPSTYHAHAAKRTDPAKLSPRAKRDVSLKVEVRRVFAENFAVYGVRKVWRQLRRESFAIARCTVERLMRSMDLAGVIRGKPVKTTVSDKAAPCPLDHVRRQFQAPRPNVLWVSDFTYVATWQASFTWRLSSTPSPAASSGGGPAGQRKPASSSMHWNRHCTNGGPSIAAGLCITATGAATLGSTGRRNGHVGQPQVLVKRLGRCLPVKGLARPGVEGQRYRLESILAVSAQVGALREILAQQSVGVLICAPLPRAMRVTKIDGQACVDLQPWVLRHFRSLIPGQRSSELLRQAGDRAEDAVTDGLSAMSGQRRTILQAGCHTVLCHPRQVQQHREPRRALHQGADRGTVQSHDEIAFQ